MAAIWIWALIASTQQPEKVQVSPGFVPLPPLNGSRSSSNSVVPEWLKETPIEVAELKPTIRILAPGEAAGVKLSNAFLVAPKLSERIEVAAWGVVLTNDGVVYRASPEGGYRKSEATWDGDFATGLAAEKTYLGVGPEMVVEVTYPRPTHPNACYLGIWNVEGQSVVGAFASDGSTSTPVQPLIQSAQPILSVDYSLSIHGPRDPVTIFRRREDGTGEIIILSVDSVKLFGGKDC